MACIFKNKKWETRFNLGILIWGNASDKTDSDWQLENKTIPVKFIAMHVSTIYKTFALPSASVWD